MKNMLEYEGGGSAANTMRDGIIHKEEYGTIVDKEKKKKKKKNKDR